MNTNYQYMGSIYSIKYFTIGSQINLYSFRN